MDIEPACSLATDMVEGRSVALAGGQLHPTAKKQTGRCEYEFIMPERAVGRLSLSITGQAVGPKSWVIAKRRLERECPQRKPVIRGSDVLKADMEMKHGTGDARFPQFVQVASGTRLKVEVQLFDDGSGAIYSSNAGLAELAVAFE